MNIVKQYKNRYDINVADLNVNEITEILKRYTIDFVAMTSYISTRDYSCNIELKGCFDNIDKLTIGDTSFFKCENINGEEMVEFNCPYWANHPDHKGECDTKNQHILNGVSYEDMEDDHWEHCESCPYFEHWQDEVAEAEGNAISDELMKILFFCMCEYKYSNILFTPVNFSLAHISNTDSFYCYNTDNKVALNYKTDNINITDFIKVIEAHSRIYSAFHIWFATDNHITALQTYGLDRMPCNYKDHVIEWLKNNKEIAEKFYTDN